MSKKWPGGIITKNQATPTGPYENGAAPGIWTLNQMTYWLKQGLWPLAGNIEQIGQQVYVAGYNGSGNATQITYTFTVPSGVTSISAVCIGSGASGLVSNSSGQPGRAGDLRWANNIAVTPGETLTVLVAEGTAIPVFTQFTGTSSELKRGSTVLLSAIGGGSINTTSGTASSTIGGNIGGGNGGNGGATSSSTAGGGGGTGGYSGNGGTGADFNGNQTLPLAGSGAAAGGQQSISGAYTGGGVNLIGLGSTAASTNLPGSYGSEGGVGSSTVYPKSGMYGSGGGGNDSSTGFAGAGRPGAVRITWGGVRSFPSNATDYLPLSANSFTQIELRFTQMYVDGTLSTPIETSLTELEIYDSSDSNLMRNPTVLTAVSGLNAMSFSSLSNDQFGWNTSTASQANTALLNNGQTPASYVSFSKPSSSTISLFIKLASARTVKQLKFVIMGTAVTEGFIPYVEVYGNGTLLGSACPVPVYNSPGSGNVTSTITFA
jgi:hypothetical protein